MSYPTLNLKQVIATSLANTLIQGDKEKIENLSMLVRESGKLYFKLKEDSFFVMLLKELQNSKGDIIRDKVFEFLKKNTKIIINSPGIINILSKSFGKFHISITPEENEENKNYIDEDSNSNELCEEEINVMENNYEESSSLANNEEFINFSNLDKMNTEDNTKEAKDETKSEKNESEEINLYKQSIDEFLKDVKFFSLNDFIDILVLDINLLNIEKHLKYFSNNTFFQDWISPEFKGNYLYIPLPNWANSFKTFNFNCILFAIIELIILLNYQIFNLKGEASKDSVGIRINDKYKRKIIKIKNLKAYLITHYPKINEFLLLPKTLNYIAENCSKSYLNKYNHQYKETNINYPLLFKDILNELKANLEQQYSKNEEIIEKLFEKITFYTFDDILYGKHFIYSSFLNEILDFTKNLISNILSPQIQKIYDFISFYKPKWYEIRNHCIKLTENLLNNNSLEEEYDIIKFSYGSYTTGLDILGSDIDFAIFYKAKKETDENFLLKLSDKIINKKNKNKILFLGIEPIPYATVPIIKLKYNLSNEINMKYFCNNIKKYKFFDIQSINEIKIDLTPTDDEKEIEDIIKMKNFIIEELNKYPIIKPVVIIIKSLLMKKNMISVWKGWLSSTAIFLMTRNIVKTYIKENHKNDLSIGKLFILFLEKFSNYNYDYIIDKDGYDIPYIQCSNNKRFIIENPIHPELNISEKSFNTEDIKTVFANLLKDIVEKLFIPF